MNEEINLAAICIADGFGALLSIIMLGARVWTRNRSNTEVKLLRMMLYTAMFSCLADMFVFVFDGKPSFLIYILLYVGNTWLFVSNMLMGTLWIMFLVTHISGKGLPPIQKTIIWTLDVLGSAVLLINFFLPLAFKISARNVYSRGPLFWLYITIEVIIVVDSMIVFFIYREKTPEAKHFPVWQFIIPIAIGIVIQSIVYGISLICPSLSLAVCGVILGLFSENEEEAEILRQNEKNAKIILEQQEKLEEALMMAQSANRAKTTFLNSMSHDIRTPMNAIIGYTELATTHIDNTEQVKDYLGKIEKSSDYLLSLINEVLDMSRIESGKMTLNEKPENIIAIVNSLYDIVQADIGAKKHDFVIDIVDVTDENVFCDKLRLNQIFLNILSNSIKYTPEHGKITMTVTEKKDALGEYAEFDFSVKDNGIGMDADYIKTLFEPFTRVNSSTVSGIQGTGLGMSIAKNLIDMMGGRIDIESEPEKGTTITVAFNFKLLNKRAKPVDPDKNEGSDKKDFAGKKILVVEDNELNREIAKAILEEHGFVVDVAEDGDIAVEIMKKAGKKEYDALLMDIQMPKMDGYEATKQIRALPPIEEHVPIIAMTANAFEEDKKMAFEAGMDAHLAKPINIEDMLDVLSHFV